MAFQLWENLKDAIVVYTGLSPATFFTGIALGLAVYYLLSSLFGSSDNHSQFENRAREEYQPLPPPKQLGEVTEEDLKSYDGTDSEKPLLMAIKGQIYDVSQSSIFGMYYTAFGLAVYCLLSSLFGSSDNNNQFENRAREDYQPLPPPKQLGEVTEEELKGYDVTHCEKPLLMAIKGLIYDVSHSRMFYGPGGPYALFAGKDASRALAKMSFEEKDLTGDISGLGPFELDALQDWEYKFMSKYVKVGTIKSTVPVTEESSTSEPAESTDKPADDRPLDNGHADEKSAENGHPEDAIAEANKE